MLSPQPGPVLLEGHVEALELALMEGQFSTVAEACTQWLGQLTGSLHSPLITRLLFVAVQSHWFLNRQSELVKQLDMFQGLLGLPPQVLQLEGGHTEECRDQIQLYVQQMVQWLTDGTNQPAAPEDTSQPEQTGAQQECEEVQGPVIFRCGTTAHPGLAQPPSAELLHEHGLPLCRLYVVDVLCHGLGDYSAAQTFLMSPEAGRLLQEQDLHMLSAEVAAAQLAAAAQESTYVTMMGEPNEEPPPPSAAFSNGTAAGSTETVSKGRIPRLFAKAWQWGRSTVLRAPTQPPGKPTSSSGSTDLVDWHVVPQGQLAGTPPPERASLDTAAPDGQAHGASPHPSRPAQPAPVTTDQALQQQPTPTTDAQQECQPQPEQRQWGQQFQAWCQSLQSWLVEYGWSRQVLEVAQTVLLALLVYALYREWKVLRTVLQRPTAAVRNHVKSLLAMAFALSPNPLTSGYMPAGRP